MIETKLAESSFDYEKLRLLEEENEAYEQAERVSFSKDELLSELQQFKIESGIIDKRHSVV